MVWSSAALVVSALDGSIGVVVVIVATSVVPS